jgi:hypothetical protein
MLHDWQGDTACKAVLHNLVQAFGFLVCLLVFFLTLPLKNLQEFCFIIAVSEAG